MGRSLVKFPAPTEVVWGIFEKPLARAGVQAGSSHWRARVPYAVTAIKLRKPVMPLATWRGASACRIAARKEIP